MRTLIAAALLAASTTASAQFMSGNDLLTRLTSDTATQRMHGLGYIVGVSDSLNSYAFCIPRGVNAGQLFDMMRNYLNNTPAERHLPADVVISTALGIAFPCPKGKGV